MSYAKLFSTDSHEQDPRWIAVDEYTQSHLNRHKHLEEYLVYASEQGLPDIASQPTAAKMLALQCLAHNVTHALEVGTLGAYTAIYLAAYNPNLKVTTLEFNPRHAEVAQHCIDKAGLSDRIEIIVGKAVVDILPKLQQDIQDGKREKLGLTYIDADKTNNWTYFDHAVKMSRAHALIYVENVVRQAKIVDPALQKDPSVIGSRKVIENAGKDSRVESVVVQTVAEKSYDGHLMAVVL